MKKFYLSFLLLLPLFCPMDLKATVGTSTNTMVLDSVDITFVVDATGLSLTADGMFLAGTFSDWTDIPMTDNEDGTWAATVRLNADDTVEYNFKNGPDGWEPGDTGDCFDEFASRILVVPAMTTTLPTVYFNSCDNNPPTEEEKVDITFTVNTDGLEVAAEGMFITGLFSNYDDVPMMDNGDNTWSITIPLVPGESTFYNFKNGPDGWEDGAGGDCFDAGASRELVVPAEATSLPSVYFNSCDNNPPPVLVKVDVTFSVNTSAITVGPLGMFILGSLTSYNEVPMMDMGDNIWSVTIPVVENTMQDYNFGTGDFDTELGFDDCFSAFNSRTFEVGAAPITLPTVYYGSCDNSPPPTYDMVDVTFTVDASEVEEIDDVIALMGNFSSWQPNIMEDKGDGIWALTFPQAVGTTIYYNYFNGFVQFEEVSGDCLDPVAQTRTMVVPDTAVTLPLAIFGSCEGFPAVTTNTTDLVVSNSVKVSPNPFQDATIVSWDNPENSSYQIMIMDLQGRIMQSYSQVRSSTLTIQRRDLPTGMYFMQFVNERGATATQKLMVK